MRSRLLAALGLASSLTTLDGLERSRRKRRGRRSIRRLPLGPAAEKMRGPAAGFWLPF